MTTAPTTNRIRLRRPASPRVPVQAAAPAPALRPAPPSAPAFPFIPSPDELGSPQAWLYVSKRLDLQWLPNTSLWAAPVLTIGLTTGSVTGSATGSAGLPLVVYYRLSAQVLTWLNEAGHHLQQLWETGKVDRSQLDAYCEAMGVVWEFAGRHISEAARDAAREAVRSRPASLPEVNAGPR